MSSEAEKFVGLQQDPKVPEELLQRLHDATQRFHLAEMAMGAAMADSDFQHQQKIDRAQEELDAAEHEVEKITMEVQSALKPPVVVKGH